MSNGYKNDEAFLVTDKFLVALDMDEGTLGFIVDQQYLNITFRGLRGKKLYPVVSGVWGHCEITMRYVGGLDRKYKTKIILKPHLTSFQNGNYSTPL